MNQVHQAVPPPLPATPMQASPPKKERASSTPVRVLAIASLVWLVLVFLGTFVAIKGATGAPQEAAASAMGMFFSVFPYVFVRFVQMLD